MTKSLSSKYGQKFLETTKKSANDTLKIVPKRTIHKATEATNDLVGNKIIEKIIKTAAKNPKKLMVVQIDETPMQPTRIPEKIQKPPERQHQTIDELRLF